MKRKTETAWPQKKMGQHCGYWLFEDGSIGPAEAHYRIMDEALDEQAALQMVTEAFTKATYLLSQTIARKQSRFWKAVREDYGLPKELSYDISDKRIRIKTPKDGEA